MSIISFPHWKHRNATPAEKLYELAEYATRHPEDVKDLILIWIDEKGKLVHESDSSVQAGNAVLMVEKFKLSILKGDGNE